MDFAIEIEEINYKTNGEFKVFYRIFQGSKKDSSLAIIWGRGNIDIAPQTIPEKVIESFVSFLQGVERHLNSRLDSDLYDYLLEAQQEGDTPEEIQEKIEVEAEKGFKRKHIKKEND